MSSHEIHHLLDLYGLVAVFLAAGAQGLGAPVPGGTVLVAAAIYASTKHGLPVVGVLVAGALGAFVGTTVAYALGRWRGEQVLVRVARLFRQQPELIPRLREKFRANASAVLFFGRFVTGVRNAVGLVAGASGMPLTRFLAVEAAAATAWSALITLEYFFFGRTIVGAATWVQVLLIGIGIVSTVLTVRLLRRRFASANQPTNDPSQVTPPPLLGP